MPLTYDFTQVKDWDKLDSSVTNTMPWLAMVIGMGEITEKNAEEFYARIHAHEKLTNMFMRLTTDTGFEPYFITLETVRKYIGMRCNVAYITPAQFTKRLWSTYRDYLKRGEV